MGILSWGKPVVKKLVAKKNIYGLTAACFHENDAIRREASREIYNFFDDSEERARHTAILLSFRLGAQSIPLLGNVLKNGDASDRACAAWALGGIESLESTNMLLSLLDDSDYRVQAETVTSLAQLNHQSAAHRLMSTLEEGQEYVRGRAALALGTMQIKSAEGKLIQALQHPFWYVSWGAAKSLGVMKSADAVDPLIRKLKNENLHKKVKVAVIRALGDIKDPRAMDAILFFLDDTSEDVRRNTAWTLGEINNPRAVTSLMARYFKESDWIVWVHILNSIIRMGKPADQEIIRLFREGDLAQQMRVNNRKEDMDSLLKEMENMKHLDGGFMEKLFPVQDIDKTIVNLSFPYQCSSELEAAVAVDLLRDREQSLDSLLKALHSKNAITRSNATLLLGYYEDQRVENAILDSLIQSDVTIRANAADAYMKIQHPKGVQPLLLGLNDPESYMRANAAEALSDPMAVIPLIGLIKDKNAVVRNNAAFSLGIIMDPRAVKPLIGTLNDDTVVEKKMSGVHSLLDAAMAVKTGLVKQWKIRDVSVAALDNITMNSSQLDDSGKWWLANRGFYID